MIQKNYSFKNFINQKILGKSQIKKNSKSYKECFLEIQNEIKSKKTLNVLNNNFKFSFNFSGLSNFKKFKTIAIIGMGGSILGIEAIHNFLNKKVNKKIYFFDDIDEQKIYDFKKNVNFKNTLFIIISKSGTTLETLSNSFSLNIFKKNAKNVIIISERKNTLFSICKKLNLFHIEHKSFIGGRYSVLSEVGIVPAFLMGINTNKLRSKISKFLKGKPQSFLKDSATNLASILRSKQLNNLIFLNYSPKLEKFLFWCQQLIAESLGKKNKGFMPIISNVPKDHHSLLQLYIDGPKDKIFYIFSLEEKNKEIIKPVKLKNNSTDIFKNKSLSKIKDAQKNALIQSFKKNNIPFRELKIRKDEEEVLGELFAYFILETVLIGKLLSINPFNQPAVEQVKIFTKNFLT